MLNGSNLDVVATDNTSSQKLVIYGTSVENRVPLYEIFTSSTCPPCKAGNEHFHSIADTSNPLSYNVLKFQQDFPGTGDPYATSETVARRNFYAINSIPRMELDGGWDGNASSFSSTLHNAYRQNKSVVNITGTFTLDTATKTITTDVSVTPLMKLPANSIRLYSAIVEKRTVKNVKTNLETEFLQVVKKLIPNENGRTLDSISINAINANVTTRVKDTYKFKDSFRLPGDGTAAKRINLATEYTVENFANLYVVTWIENKGFKMVLQSNKLKNSAQANSYTDTFHEKAGLLGNTSSDKEVNGTFNLTNGTTYVWEVDSSKVKSPTNWSITSICDNIDCYLYPATLSKEFTAKANKTDNYVKVGFIHNRKVGYGYAEVNIYEKANKIPTLKTYKYSLLVSNSSSTSVISPVEDKLLYYFDKRIFIDNDHRGATLTITDMNGKKVLNSKINSNAIDFTPNTKGVYIANVIAHGEIVNTRKFIVE
jgi:thiol-disulfide isomerase/thioredoxin